MENPGIVLSRDRLLDRVWGMTYPGGTRTVDVHVAPAAPQARPARADPHGARRRVQGRRSRELVARVPPAPHAAVPSRSRLIVVALDRRSTFAVGVVLTRRPVERANARATSRTRPTCSRSRKRSNARPVQRTLDAAAAVLRRQNEQARRRRRSRSRRPYLPAGARGSPAARHREGSVPSAASGTSTPRRPSQRQGASSCSARRASSVRLAAVRCRASLIAGARRRALAALARSCSRARDRAAGPPRRRREPQPRRGRVARSRARRGLGRARARSRRRSTRWREQLARRARPSGRSCSRSATS